jgi:hypothetical protein
VYGKCGVFINTFVETGDKMLKKWWRIWAKSLGEKVGETDQQANTIAVIRTVWWLTHMATCIFIILNAIANHGWNLL